MYNLYELWSQPVLAQVIQVVELLDYDDFSVGEHVYISTASLSRTNQYQWYKGTIKEKYKNHALIYFSNGTKECFKYFDIRKIY